MPEKDLIEEQLKKIRKFFERKYFKISELDKEQHRLKGRYERLARELAKIRTKLDGTGLNAKDIRKYGEQIKACAAEKQILAGAATLLREMRMKIKLMDMEEDRLRAELIEIETGEE